ncbi:MAG: 6,7-dimethyl-8-ribityllumazine synthase [Candidatus Aphodosoma sp.]
MATKYHNLSEYDAATLPSASELDGKRIAIVVADWNDDITRPMKDGAVEELLKNGVQERNIEVYHVPGTFELTYAASKLMKETSESGKTQSRYDAVIVIGCVIQGDTPHFDYVCQGVTQGATMLNAKAVCPVIFSVLTTLDKQQALDRAGGVLGNKGVEGAVTALKMIKTFGGIG